MNKDAPRNTKTSLWQRITLAILVVLSTLILIEVGLRFGGFIIRSLREYRNITSVRQKGTYVIMCLGESTTTDGPGPYPEQLEKVLNQHNIGVKFVVLNKGVPTINTQYILTHLESNLDKYHPDLVVTMMGINDKYTKYYEGLKDANSKLFNTFKTYKFARLIQKNILEKEKLRGFSRVGELAKPDTLISYDYSPQKTSKGNVNLSWVDNVRGWLFGKEKNNLQTEKEYQKAIKLNPQNADAYTALGWLYMQKRRYPQAQEMLQRAVKLNSSNPQAYFGLGILYNGSGEYAQAEEVLKKAISLSPNYDIAYAALGWIYMQTNNYAKAEELFKAAIQYNPRSDKMYRALIELYRQIGDNHSVSEYCMLKDKLKLIDDSVTYITRRNYREVKKILNQRKIKLVCVQYPVRALLPLKKIFEGQSDVFFVDNEKIFKDALQKSSYGEYFIDMFAGDFGHCTEKGNKLLAENIASVILKEVFNKEVAH